ncbi:hypothetical protein CHS0354_034299 [Potamilus streckersoni]|uniref:Alpha-2-macroglobulin receptor-associated protein n=1 Tax=Potamilus streckersoni TaxID=2493646 RepID=A0AAE0TBS8_9BIVA|nr:hypothetical protein CHS0354_034299 [Potamilus streckersoni]
MATFIASAAFVYIVLLSSVATNKYDEKLNVPNFESAKTFRMQKVNNLWEKAKKVLSADRLSELYQELVNQDNLEKQVKKNKHTGLDDDGLLEAEARDKFLDIIRRYKLEVYFNVPPANGDDNKLMLRDEKLIHLWKKAQRAGFSGDELQKLKEEFHHQQLKLDEYNAVKEEFDTLQGQLENSLNELEESEGNWKELHLKKKGMKTIHSEIKKGIENLEKKLEGNSEREFQDERVYDLWLQAKQSNMTAAELETFKSELKHFEHRIEKHGYLEEELEHRAQYENQYGDDEVPHKDLKEKVHLYGKKVKKHHEDLKHRVKMATKHSEL